MAEYTQINFLKYRYFAAFFSVALVAVGVAGYVYNGGFTYSVDFSGGTQVMFNFSSPIGSEQLRTTLAKKGWGDIVVRELGGADVVVRVNEFTSDVAGLAQKIKNDLTEQFPTVTITVSGADAVGPAAGKLLFKNGIILLVLGLLLMMLYIAWRFWSLSYGIGAMVAIFHDAIAILTVCACFKFEISQNIIMAILAVLSYSINDTIIIFARIRENVAKEKGKSLEAIVNQSINQTLRRTLLTSFATMLATSALLIFGGEALRTFSLSLIIGIVIGTYSSIYVASPVMLALRRYL